MPASAANSLLITSSSFCSLERLAAEVSSKNGAKIKKLWQGDWSDYPSQSEADIKLCSDLAWWCDYEDPSRVDRLFRHSQLYREKWDDSRRSDGATYGQMTLETAFAGKKAGDGYKAQRTVYDDDKISDSNQEAHFSGLNSLSAKELMATEYVDVPCVIDGILPSGLTVLAARPKMGKSWLALDMAISVASGKRVLGRETNQGDVLYFALEDNHRRMKSRMEKILGNHEAPDRLNIVTRCDRLDKGSQEQIFDWIATHPKARLVVIDTWGKIAPSKKGQLDDYTFLTEVLGPIQQKALERDMAIILVHHNRKPSKDGDVFDQVLGSTAFTALADAIIVLQRERLANTAVLACTGRDIEETELGIIFDEELGTWSTVGSVDQMKLPPAQQAAYDSIEKGNNTPKLIAKHLNKSPSTVQNTLKTLLGKGMIQTNGDGVYQLKSNSVGHEVNGW